MSHNKQNPYLLENSLYDVNDQASKDAYFNDPKLVINSFLFNFIGIVAIYASTQKKEAIQRYVTGDKQVRVSNIGDDNNDMSIAIKAMADGKMFITDKTVTEITRFLAKFKTKQIDKIDTAIIQGWLDQIKPAELKTNINGRMRGILDEFGKTQNIVELAYGLKMAARIRTTKGIGAEFKELSKKSKLTRKVDPAVTVQPVALDDPAKPSADVLDKATSATTPVPDVITPTKTPQVTPKPAAAAAPKKVVPPPPPALKKFNVYDVYADLNKSTVSHNDIVRLYTAPNLAQKKELVAMAKTHIGNGKSSRFNFSSGPSISARLSDKGFVNVMMWIEKNVAKTFKGNIINNALAEMRKSISYYSHTPKYHEESLLAFGAYQDLLKVADMSAIDKDFQKDPKIKVALFHALVGYADKTDGWIRSDNGPIQAIIDIIRNAKSDDWYNVETTAAEVGAAVRSAGGMDPYVLAHNFSRGPASFVAIFNSLQRSYKLSIKGGEISWVLVNPLGRDDVDLNVGTITAGTTRQIDIQISARKQLKHIIAVHNIVPASTSAATDAMFLTKLDNLSSVALYEQMRINPDMIPGVVDHINNATTPDQLDKIEHLVIEQYELKSDYDLSINKVFRAVNDSSPTLRSAIISLIRKLIKVNADTTAFSRSATKAFVLLRAGHNIRVGRDSFGADVTKELVEFGANKVVELVQKGFTNTWIDSLSSSNGIPVEENLLAIENISPSSAKLLVDRWVIDVSNPKYVNDPAEFWVDRTLTNKDYSALIGRAPQQFKDERILAAASKGIDGILEAIQSGNNTRFYNSRSIVEKALANQDKNYSSLLPQLKVKIDQIIDAVEEAARTKTGTYIALQALDVIGEVADESMVDKIGPNTINELPPEWAARRLNANPSQWTRMWNNIPRPVILKLLKRQMAESEFATKHLKEYVRSSSITSVQSILTVQKHSGAVGAEEVGDILGEQLSIEKLTNTVPPGALGKSVSTNINNIVYYLDTELGSEIPDVIKDELFSKALVAMDSLASKTSATFKDALPITLAGFVSAMENDKVKADKVYSQLSISMKRRVANSYIQRQTFIGDALLALENTDSNEEPIVPYQKLDHKRILDILKYNNIITEESKLPISKIRDVTTLDREVSTRPKVEFPKLAVAETTMAKYEMEKLSVKMHLKQRNNKHGRGGMIILRSFNVAIPLQATEQEKFLTSKPSSEIINPMFHGTGSVAASMILRTGFRVVASGDASVVGRMLGDGIYGAIHIDKAQQYVGDNGFSRAAGIRGYIFEMNAALGEPGKDYNVAGLGGDTIRSPEWCVFNANAQYKIFKAHEVVIVKESTIDALVAKYRGELALEEGLVKFGNYLKEGKDRATNVNQTTFTFLTGVIPISATESVDFEDFKPTNPNVWVEPSAYGPMVVINNTETSEAYTVRCVAELQGEHPELLDVFLAAIS